MNERLNFVNNPIGQAVAEITVLQQEVATMGANETEHLSLEALKNEVMTGNLSPDEGVKKALEIRYSKQEYH